MQKTCSKCGTVFGCKNEAPGCWCESVYVDATTLALLKKQFSNCLCPACLQSYGNSSATQQQKINTNT
jgi:hypothetical protein